MAMDGIEVSLDFKRSKYMKLMVLTEEMSERAARAIGTIYVRYLAANTPPNAFGGEVSRALRNRKNEAIRTLQQRIGQNIAGVDNVSKLQPNVEPEKVGTDAWDFRWLNAQRPGGMFGMLVPNSWRAVRGENPPESTPEEIYGTPEWRGGKMVAKSPYNADYRLSSYTYGFVRLNKLREFVKMKQSHVGKLISGWAPAARAFAAGKRIATGFFEGLGGKGFGKLYKNKHGVWGGIAINRQSYSDAQREHIQRMANVSTKRTVQARKAQLAAIKRWYTNEAKKKLK